MTKRCLQFVSLAVALVFCAVKPDAAAAQARPAPAGPRAGSITALLPTAKITRGTGRTRSILEAKKGDEVVYNDLIQTERGGRARITLNDQSILSLGSQAELRIVKHDARTQQTALQLGYGRVRAEVASVTRDGGRFELRTPTAVAGVIGTDFGTDSSIPGVTAFICISGIVQVSNSDEKVAGTVPCPAGSTTTVNKGLPPTAPKPATQQQIQQLIQDTEPAVISSLSPASALVGTEVVTAASGSKMNGINAVSISGTGVSVSLDGTPTDSNANVKVVVGANAAPGTRTLTFTKANGQSTAAVFSVLAPPKKGDGGSTDLEALKKSYLEILEQERQSAISGVNALGIGVQQSAADTRQAIENDNNKLQPPLDVAPLEKDIQAAVTPMIQDMTAAGGSINEDTANAGKQLDTLFAEAQKRAAALETPPTDDEKLKIAKDIFDRVNTPLLRNFKGIQDGLGTIAKTVNAKLLQTMSQWSENLKIEAAKQKAVPIPKVDADERSYDVGLVASFDAARSTATPGGSISNYSWVLCDPGYKPQQVGVPLPPNDTRCRPLAGYASTSSDFKFPTCQLNPQDYIARVTITDTNSKSTAMDVRVRVLPPQYEPPGTRLRSLSDAYQQLQPNTFTSFFDESFSGLTELQESIRRTFNSLASMNINLRLSQAAIDCNEATVRADWDQNYTFKEDLTCLNAPAGTLCQRVVFKQQEQLTVRMKRVPGKNWYITEFQGDNGTVQGTPPGPIQRDLSLPDLRIASLTTASLPAAAKEDSVIGIAPGANGFAAVVENVGQADLQGSVKVRFVATDGNGNVLASDVRDLPGPIPVGGSATVTGALDVPDLGPGVNARIFAAVNPGCVVVEQNCDGANAKLLEIIIGIVDLQVTGFSPVGTPVGTQPGQLNVQVKNIGSRASVATANNLRLFFGTTVAGSASLPIIAPGATATVPLSFVAPNLAGAQSVLVAIAPPTIGEFNPANDNLSGSLTLAAPVVDLKASALAFSGGAPPFLSGQTVNVTLNVQNNGNRPSVGTDLLSCRLTNTTVGTQAFGPVALAPIAAGATATGLAYSFVVPVNFAGGDTLNCGVSQDPFEPAGKIGDNSVNIGMVVNLNVDLQVVNVPVPTGADQMGANASVTFGIRNFGPDTAPPGWNVALKINGSPVVSQVASAPLPGLTTAPVTFNYVTPQIAPAPADIANVPASLEVNTNAAIAETNTGNNIVTAALRLVDFTLTPIPTATLKAVNGRNFFANAVQVLPTTYPLPLVITYTGLPAGINPGALPGQNIVGTPAATAGAFTILAQGAAEGVTHTASGSFAIQLANEITLTPGAAPTLTAASGGGPAQNVTIAVAGGIYPLTLTVIQPPGITITGPTTLTAPGNVTYSLSAGLVAATGAQTFPFKAQDSGSSPNTPGNFAQGPVGYTVTPFVDLKVLPFSFVSPPPFIGGQSVGLQLNLGNAGNNPSNGADTYNCSISGPGGTFSIGSGTIAAIAGQGGTTTIPVVFVMPANMDPSSNITCSVSQDPLEGGAALSDNSLTTAVAVTATFANYIISSAATPAHINGAGADALQVGELVQVDFSVQNLGNFTQTGTVSLDFTSTCSPTFSTSVPAPAAGATVSGSFTQLISCSPGGYSRSATITSAPPESSLSDNTVGPFSFQVFDFTLTNAAPLSPQNVPLAGMGLVQMALGESGPAAPLALPLLISNGGKAQTNPSSGSVSPGTIPIQVTASAGTVSGDSEIITAQITRLGVTRSDTQHVIFYTAAVNNITSGQPGATNANPILLPIGFSGGAVNFKLVGDFVGSATYLPPTVTGFTASLGSATPSLPNDTFTLLVNAVAGAPLTVTAIPLVFDIPNTNPPQQVSTILYVKAFEVPDIQPASPVGTGAIFGGRDFTTYPLLEGEGGDLSIQFDNIGSGPSSSGVQAKVRLGTFGAVISTSPIVLPSIPAGGNYVATVHVRAPIALAPGSTGFVVEVDPDPLENNTSNNSAATAITISDWHLALSGTGNPGNEMAINVPAPGSANTTLAVVLGGPGSVYPGHPLDVSAGAVSTYITPVLPADITTTQPVTISASTTPQTPNGEYAVQVIAKMKDGATVTLQRAVVIHVWVNGGTPVDTVTLASSGGNAIAGPPSTCSGPCTPVQIDGLLVESLNLTATRTGGSSGATDLIFADDGNTIISRVTTSGSPQVQQITALPYSSPVQVNFAAQDDGAGSVNATSGYTIVAATAVSTAQRGAPPLDPVGTQHTTLYFKVGDLNIGGFGCLAVGPGGSLPVSVQFLDLNGFNKAINWQWISTGGLNFSITNPSGSSAAPPYTNANSTLVNNEASEIFTQVNFVLAVTISNGNGSATKFFNIGVRPSTNGCLGGAGLDSAAARAEGVPTKSSFWKRGAMGMTSMARSVQRVAPSSIGLPDLQIKPVDVSVSPSIPQPGDTLDIRFKVTNAGDGAATEVPIALQVNGKIVATETYNLKAGASTLGAFQFALPAQDDDRDRPARVRPARYTKNADGPLPDGEGERPIGAGQRAGVEARLLIDPAGTIKQKTTANKAVALTKAGLVAPVDGVPGVPAERVYLEMNTVCAGFRLTSGAVVDCEGGADLDIAIEDFKTSRFTLNAPMGVADLGIIDPNTARADGAQFNSNASLVLGHTYAVQMTGGKVGYVKFSASLTPRQLEAEAKRRFGLNGVRILKKLGADTGSTGAGDVSGRISADALMYFDMMFRP